jgi:pimeloyl-ACP methyl ester carboxylesterase
LGALLTTSPSSASASGSTTISTWVDQNVTFTSQGITIYGTFRHLASSTTRVPAVLLIAGSGPTDRNGNSPLETGPVNTLKTLADWLSEDGVATLRYDKLGSGDTGLGPYQESPGKIGITVYEHEARSALLFLSKQKGVNNEDLGVVGHSEGALFALLLASGASGPTPSIKALGLLEPLSQRYLDLITDQVNASLQAHVKSGAITSALETTVQNDLAKAVTRLRTKGTVATDLPYGLANILNPANALFLRQADSYDPAQLASTLKGPAVLLTCSNADIQITCGEVDRIASGLQDAGAAYDYVHLRGVDHVLKVDSSMTGAKYSSKLPFSPQLRSSLRKFVLKYL